MTTTGRAATGPMTRTIGTRGGQVREIQVGTYLIDKLRECKRSGNTDTANCIIAGMRGEFAFRQYLRKIVDSNGPGWTAFYNVPVGHGDVDCILLGPSTLLAVEIKSNRGVVIYDQGAWLHLKLSDKGLPYRGYLRDPLRQLLWAVRGLKQWFSVKGVRAYGWKQWSCLLTLMCG